MYIITVKSNKNDYWRSLVQDAKIGACLAEYESDNQSHRFMVFESIEEAKSYRDEDFAKMLRDYEELEECKLTSSIEYVSNARLRRIYNER